MIKREEVRKQHDLALGHNHRSPYYAWAHKVVLLCEEIERLHQRIEQLEQSQEAVRYERADPREI